MKKRRWGSVLAVVGMVVAVAALAATASGTAGAVAQGTAAVPIVETQFQAFGLSLRTEPQTIVGLSDSPAPSATLLSQLTKHLFKGWNPIQWNLAVTKDTREALQPLISQGILAVAWRFVNVEQRWIGFDPEVPDQVNDLREVTLGDILWLFTTAEFDWVIGS